MKDKIVITNTDQYISTFPQEIQEKLECIRAYISEAAPGATECISYGMPAFRTDKVLVYFAGYKGHVGFYPTGAGISAFESELAAYTFSKGAIQFPHDKKIPKALVQKITRYRMKMVLEETGLKKTKKKSVAGKKV